MVATATQKTLPKMTHFRQVRVPECQETRRHGHIGEATLSIVVGRVRCPKTTKRRSAAARVHDREGSRPSREGRRQNWGVRDDVGQGAVQSDFVVSLRHSTRPSARRLPGIAVKNHLDDQEIAESPVNVKHVGVAAQAVQGAAHYHVHARPRRIRRRTLCQTICEKFRLLCRY